jgi:hypothetical protein
MCTALFRVILAAFTKAGIDVPYSDQADLLTRIFRSPMEQIGQTMAALPESPTLDEVKRAIVDRNVLKLIEKIAEIRSVHS